MGGGDRGVDVPPKVRLAPLPINEWKSSIGNFKEILVSVLHQLNLLSTLAYVRLLN